MKPQLMRSNGSWAEELWRMVKVEEPRYNTWSSGWGMVMRITLGTISKTSRTASIWYTLQQHSFTAVRTLHIQNMMTVNGVDTSTPPLGLPQTLQSSPLLCFLFNHNNSHCLLQLQHSVTAYCFCRLLLLLHIWASALHTTTLLLTTITTAMKKVQN